jgi:hypothetical protein
MRHRFYNLGHAGTHCKAFCFPRWQARTYLTGDGAQKFLTASIGDGNETIWRLITQIAIPDHLRHAQVICRRLKELHDQRP